MIKKYISRTLAVFAAAAAVSACGGMAVYAETDQPLLIDEPAAQILTVQDNFGGEADYQITNVGKTKIGEDDKYIYYEDDDTGEITKKAKKDWVKIILIGLGISLVVTAIVVYAIYHSYKYNGMTEPYEYKNKAPLELTEKEDQLIDVHVTKRHIERNNN